MAEVDTCFEQVLHCENGQNLTPLFLPSPPFIRKRLPAPERNPDSSRYHCCMLFMGLDLAWGRKNTSGGCVLFYDGKHPATVAEYREALGDDEEIIAWVRQWRAADHEGLVLGIDAPLLVPNATGKRQCETEIGKRFAKYQAGAHPANRQIFGDDVRGERLVSRLGQLGIMHHPYLISPRPVELWQAMEVFPHPAHIVLFQLARTLKYKAKTGRNYESRWAAMNAYACNLRKLETQYPPLLLPKDWPPPDVTGMIGGALKRLEDGLDALTCAYIVYWYWWHGADGAEVIGNMIDGYIVVPKKV